MGIVYNSEESRMKIFYCGWGGQGGQMIINAMRKLGNEVYTFYYRDKAKESGDLSFKLFSEVKLQKTDVLFIFKGELLDPAAVKLLKAEKIKIVYFTPDDPQLFIRSRVCREIGLNSDYAFTCCEDTRKKYEAAGVKAVLAYFGFSPDYYEIEIFDNTDTEIYGCEVLILGTCYLHNIPNRVQIAQTIINEGIDLKIFGNGWENSGIDKRYLGGMLTPPKISKAIYGARIVINDFYMKGDKYINLRFFEVLGMGRLCMCYRQEGVSSFFPDKKMVVYWDTLDDLVKQIKFYLANDKAREEIALAGKKEVLAKWKTIDQVKKMLETIK